MILNTIRPSVVFLTGFIFVLGSIPTIAASREGCAFDDFSATRVRLLNPNPTKYGDRSIEELQDKIVSLIKFSDERAISAEVSEVSVRIDMSKGADQVEVAISGIESANIKRAIEGLIGEQFGYHRHTGAIEYTYSVILLDGGKLGLKPLSLVTTPPDLRRGDGSFDGVTKGVTEVVKLLNRTPTKYGDASIPSLRDKIIFLTQLTDGIAISRNTKEVSVRIDMSKGKDNVEVTIKGIETEGMMQTIRDLVAEQFGFHSGTGAIVYTYSVVALSEGRLGIESRITKDHQPGEGPFY